VNLIGRVESGFWFTIIVELLNEDSQAMLYSGEIGSSPFATAEIPNPSATVTQYRRSNCKRGGAKETLVSPTVNFGRAENSRPASVFDSLRRQSYK
jgi:hypothetical protein